MMKKCGFLAVFLWGASLSFSAEVKDASVILNDAIRQAQERECPIFLQVSAEWCGWCSRMSSYIQKDEAVKQSMAENYQYVKIMLEDKDAKAVLTRYPRVVALPHIFILDQNGEILHSQYTGSLEKKGSYDSAKFMDLLTAWENYSEAVEKSRQTFEPTLVPMPKPSGLEEGLVCNFYKGKWQDIPSFSELKVDESFVIPAVSAGKYKEEEFLAMQFVGWVHIKTAGRYLLRLSSNDGSRFLLDGQVVIDNGGLHRLTDKYNQIELAAGYYPFEVGYFRNGGKFGLVFSFVAADSAKEPTYYHRDVAVKE